MKSTSLNQQVTNSYQRAVEGGFDNAAQHWKKGLLAIMVGVVSLCTWEFIAGQQGMLAQKRRQSQNTQLQVENQALVLQVNDLAERNHGLATDPFIAEKTSRENLLKALPGEIVYRFNETPNADTDTPLTFKDVTVVPTPAKKDPKEKPSGH